MRLTNTAFARYLTAIIALLPSIAAGQWLRDAGARGFVPGASFDASGIENVNMVNGNMVLNVPLASLPAGPAGLGLGLNLVYNSTLFDTNRSYLSYTSGGSANPKYQLVEDLQPGTTGGWRYGYQYAMERRERPRMGPCLFDGHIGAQQYGPNENIYLYQMRVLFPDGSIHVLYPTTPTPPIPTYWTTHNFPGGTTDPADWSQSAYDPAGKPGGCDEVGGNLSQYTGSMTYFTNDGTYVRAVFEVATAAQIFNHTDGDWTQRTWHLYFPDGRNVAGRGDQTDKICDRNNICVTIEPGNRDCTTNCFMENKPNVTTTLKDAAGRSIEIEHGIQDIIRQAGYGGTTITWTITYTDVPTNFLYPCFRPGTLGAPQVKTDCPYSRTLSGVSQIDLAGPGHLNYQFFYDPDSGELAHIILPYGAETFYTWPTTRSSGTDPDATYFLTPATDLPLESKSLTYTEAGPGTGSRTWQYSFDALGTSAQVLQPDCGVKTYYYYDRGYGAPLAGHAFRTDLPDGSRQEEIWGGELNGNGNPQLKASIISSSPVAPIQRCATALPSYPSPDTPPEKTAFTTYAYDANGNMTSRNEYDWVFYNSVNPYSDLMMPASALNSLGTLKRTTTIKYVVDAGTTVYTNPAAPNLLNAPASIDVTGSSSGSSASHSFTAFSYLDPATGNPTATMRWNSVKGALPSSTAGITCATQGYFDVTCHEYDTQGNVTKVTNPRGYITTYTYNSNYDLETATEAGGLRSWRYAWDDSTGLPTCTTDETDTDHKVSLVRNYDEIGRPEYLKDGVTGGCSGTPSLVTHTIYDDTARTVETDTDLAAAADGLIKTRVTHDQRGRAYQTETTDENGALGIKSLNYDVVSGGYTYRLQSNPYGTGGEAGAKGWTRTKFDQNGRLIESARFDGDDTHAPTPSATPTTGAATTTYSGITTRVKDEDHKQRDIDVDGLGRTARVADGSVTATYGYDALDDLVSVKLESATLVAQNRSFVYNSLRQLTNATNPETGLVAWTYDPNGNVKTREDDRIVAGTSDHFRTTMTYDALDRITKKEYRDGTPAVDFTYDDPDVLYSRGRVTRIKTSGGATPETYRDITEYDPLGRIKGVTQTFGPASSAPVPVTHTYIPAGIQTTTLPSGTEVTYTFDSAGHVSGATVGSTKTYASLMAYAPHGAMKSMKLGNNIVETTVFNSHLQVTSITAGIMALGYDYGTLNNGNVRSQTITRGTLNRSQSFGYDSSNRLICASEKAGLTPGTCGVSADWTETHGYDTWGNHYVTATFPEDLSAPTAEGQFSATTNHIVKRSNDVAMPNAYDSAGNLTNHTDLGQFSYDGENRQISATPAGGGTTTTYVYDGEGHRVAKTAGTATTYYMYDGAGQMVAEFPAVAPTTTKTLFLTADALGTTRLVTDASQSVVSCPDYLPFGQKLGSLNGRSAGCFSGTDPAAEKGFTGKERDSESGLDYFGARYLSSAQGRWTSPDWSATPQAVPYADLADPQTLNLYSYVRNNPLSKADADGHCFWDVCVGEAIAVGTAVAATATYLASPAGRKALAAGLELLDRTATAAGEGLLSLGGAIIQSGGRSASQMDREDLHLTFSKSAQGASTNAPKSAEEMASDLASKTGKNSVPYETPSAKGHIDVAGKGHFDKATGTEIPTPHVQERPKNTGPQGQVNLGPQTTRPATKQDIRTAERLAKEQGLLP